MKHKGFSVTGPLAAGIMLLAAGPGGAQAPAEPQHRPKTCLVLSGGGARGVAHVGVLKVLEELRIPIDCVVGTSMGAILGGAWASGTPAAEIERIVREVDWGLVLSDDPPRPERSARAKELERLRMTRAEFGVRNGEAVFPLGVRSGQQLEPVLQALAGIRAPVATFDELPIPFRAIATDIENGQMVVLDHGNMTAALRASMSVPGMFAPQQIDGRLLADGGLVRNLGIDVAREQLGAERIIAVNLGTPLLKRERLVSLFGVTEQMLNILTEQNVTVSRAQLGDGDRLIEPELGDFRSSDFARSPETIAIGERAARAAAAALEPFTVSTDEYAAWRAAHHAATPLMQFARAQVDTSSLTRVDPASVQAIFESAIEGDTSDASLRRGVRALYRTDDFELVGVSVGQDEQSAVIVHPREKSWGPNYARFGLTLSTDGEGESAFNVLGDVRATWLNRRALEWRSTGTLGDLTGLTSELLQPLDLQRKWFVTGGIDLGQRIDNFIVDDVAVARFRNRGARATVNVGRYLGRVGEARAGYEYGRVSSSLVSGDAGVPNSEDDIGALRFQFTADRLDNWDFPSNGYYAAADVRVAQGGLGSDLEYERYQVDLQKAFGAGRHGLTLAARFGETVGDSVPVFDSFGLGGFQNLSGASERQFLGRDVLFGRVVYRYQLRGIEALADRLFLGGSLEAGRIQDRLNGTLGTDEDLRFATSAFLAASTVLGPVYLGGGVSEGGDRALYLFVGRP